jgi:predicted nuclease of predicted toxin-antitoxin system
VKIKLDENLPDELVSVLSNLGHDVDTVRAERLVGADDETVWSASQSAGRLLITLDLDFSDIRRFSPGSHHGLMLLRLHNPSRSALAARTSDVFQREDASSWARCVVVVTERKVRVRRP